MEKVVNNIQNVEKEAAPQKEWHRPIVTRMEMKKTMAFVGSRIDGITASI